MRYENASVNAILSISYADTKSFSHFTRNFGLADVPSPPLNHPHMLASCSSSITVRIHAHAAFPCTHLKIHDANARLKFNVRALSFVAASGGMQPTNEQTCITVEQ